LVSEKSPAAVSGGIAAARIKETFGESRAAAHLRRRCHRHNDADVGRFASPRCSIN
jgi:hypothetical protein